mmetsp:Transcript_34805/g.46188  ORF Transcript_34805/g.46188 Transcript_34805/m.46188 type:complete len:268 (-) Transcript_34805:584-1387(-)
MEIVPLTKDDTTSPSLPKKNEKSIEVKNDCNYRSNSSPLETDFDEVKKDEVYSDFDEYEDNEYLSLLEASSTDEEGGHTVSSGVTFPTGILSRLSHTNCTIPITTARTKKILKRILFTSVAIIAIILIIDHIRSPAEKRLIRVSDIRSFLLKQIKDRPFFGLCIFIIAYGFTIVVLIPSAPLTVGVGYVCKESFGWVIGLFLGVSSSMLGSMLGSVLCFVIARYLMRDAVRNWARKKYPIFDALDLGKFLVDFTHFKNRSIRHFVRV